GVVAVRGDAVATEDWLQVPVSDAADYLDREPPRDLTEEKGPVKLRPVHERDAALKEHLETTHYFDEETGELYEPETPPPVAGIHDDDDEDDDEMWAIEFRAVDGDRLIGRVRYDGSQLQSDRAVDSMVEDMEPDEV